MSNEELKDERAAFDMSDAEWCDVFERVAKTVPNVFGSYARVRAAFAREAIRIADAARAAQPPAAEGAKEPVELADIPAQLDEGSGVWRSCSGCHETIDGYDTGYYPYSKVMHCYLGSGCSECGGIGAVWDNTDYGAMADAMAAAPASSASERTAEKGNESLAFAYGNALVDRKLDGSYRTAEDADVHDQNSAATQAINDRILAIAKDAGGSAAVLWKCNCCTCEFSAGIARPSCPNCKAGDQYTYRSEGRQCKGMNCGATDGISHSLECHAEHAAAIAGGEFAKDDARPAPANKADDEEIIALAAKHHIASESPVFNQQIVRFAEDLLVRVPANKAVGLTRPLTDTRIEALYNVVPRCIDGTFNYFGLARAIEREILSPLAATQPSAEAKLYKAILTIHSKMRFEDDCGPPGEGWQSDGLSSAWCVIDQYIEDAAAPADAKGGKDAD